MKKAGWILTIISALVIIYNVFIIPYQNRRSFEEHPFVTVFSSGANLKRYYTFLPPFTIFEFVIIALGVIGVALIVAGIMDKEDPKEK